MKPYYEDNHIRIYNKDCRDMSELPDESVQCVVTSPPYWGLRKYAGDQDLIWENTDCQHDWVPDMTKHDNLRFRGEHSIVGNERNRDIHCVHSWNPTPTQEAYAGRKRFIHSHNGDQAKRINRKDNPECWEQLKQGDFCSLCGAWKGAYGLEPTPELYVQHTIEILREIRRVLRKDGVCFFNIGDSYASGKGSCFNPGGGSQSWKSWNERKGIYNTKRLNKSDLDSCGLKPKDLCLIPFRVAIAAQEDGWWVRSVIIWSKQNPMPESVKDRPTESHEYILMLTKSARYYWDQEAVREPYTEPMNRWGGETLKRDTSKTAEYKEMQNIGYSSAFRVGRPMRPDPGGRNIRTVWEFPTKPYPGAHFAVFPDKLPEICIKAATPEAGCCSKCGEPWTRVIKKGFTDHTGETESQYPEGTTAKRLAKLRQSARVQGGEYQNTSETIGWQPTCKCDAPAVPSLVLDPFMGAGTTLLVAKKLNRYAVGYDTSEEYCRLTIERVRQQVLM